MKRTLTEQLAVNSEDSRRKTVNDDSYDRKTNDEYWREDRTVSVRRNLAVWPPKDELKKKKYLDMYIYNI